MLGSRLVMPSPHRPCASTTTNQAPRSRPLSPCHLIGRFSARHHKTHTTSKRTLGTNFKASMSASATLSLATMENHGQVLLLSKTDWGRTNETDETPRSTLPIPTRTSIPQLHLPEHHMKKLIFWIILLAVLIAVCAPSSPEGYAVGIGAWLGILFFYGAVKFCSPPTTEQNIEEFKAKGLNDRDAIIAAELRSIRDKPHPW